MKHEQPKQGRNFSGHGDGNMKSVKPQKPPRTQHASYPPKNPQTSWGGVASWYDGHLAGSDTYHQKVLLPNLLRLVAPEKGDVILDLACGQGFFTKAFAEKGAKMIGVDVGEELIALAQRASPHIAYHVGSGENLTMVKDKSVHKVTIVLAIQNIEHVGQVLSEAMRVLKKGGALHIAMNHPAYRIPKDSSWEFDSRKGTQYRRVDRYLSESKSAIDMHPGKLNSPRTISFHRPLQYYFKLLGKAGFAVDRLEEWISHRASDSGPRAEAENIARKEIPLFLYIRAQKFS